MIVLVAFEIFKLFEKVGDSFNTIVTPVPVDAAAMFITPLPVIGEFETARNGGAVSPTDVTVPTGMFCQEVDPAPSVWRN